MRLHLFRSTNIYTREVCVVFESHWAQQVFSVILFQGLSCISVLFFDKIKTIYDAQRSLGFQKKYRVGFRN